MLSFGIVKRVVCIAFACGLLCLEPSPLIAEGRKLNRSKATRKAGSLLPASKRLSARHRNLQRDKLKKGQPILSDKERDLKKAHKYGKEYARVQREFNGGMPDEILSEILKGDTHGKVPYWDIEPDVGAQLIIGVDHGSPFRTSEGKVRFFNHYLNANAREELISKFGDPTGEIEAEMTSSYRTLLLFPKNEIPYMLKFSGSEFYEKIDVYAAKANVKDLQGDDVRSSIENSLHLRKSPIITPEPAGLVIEDLDINMIYRPLPMPKTQSLKKGDRVITWQVFMSEEFRETKEGKSLFENHGGYDTWLKNQAAPRLAKLIYHSIFTDFTHLELHSQNIDVIVDSVGNIIEMQVKDLLDIMHDPVARAILNPSKRSHLARRSTFWGDAEESGKFRIRNETYSFHSQFLEQTRSGSSANFQRMIYNGLLDVVEDKFDFTNPEAQKSFDEFIGVNFPPDAIYHLRLAILKEEANKKFIEDHRQRSHFEKNESVYALEKYDTERFTLKNTQLEFGTLNGYPVAVVRKSGNVDKVYFSF